MNDEGNKLFWENETTRGYTQNTKKLSSFEASDFDVIFFVGGFGTMWDFPEDDDVHRLIRTAYENNKIVAAVCHGPVALLNVKLSNGMYLV